MPSVSGENFYFDYLFTSLLNYFLCVLLTARGWIKDKKSPVLNCYVHFSLRDFDV